MFIPVNGKENYHENISLYSLNYHVDKNINKAKNGGNGKTVLSTKSTNSKFSSHLRTISRRLNDVFQVIRA